MSTQLATIHNKNVEYKPKYKEVCDKFWTLQNLEATEQERQYMQLIMLLDQNAKEWKESIENLQKENEHFINKLSEINYDKIEEEYEAAKKEYLRVEKVKNMIENVRTHNY